jgi:predicted CoA-binding protein
MSHENVVIIGASIKPERYSYKAMKMLAEHGHTTLLVHPNLDQIEGQKVYDHPSDINSKVDTVTMYVKPELQTAMMEEIINLKPKRVIFNPGTENPAFAEKLKEHNIESEEACTLVLLSTNQF